MKEKVWKFVKKKAGGCLWFGVTVKHKFYNFCDFLTWLSRNLLRYLLWCFQATGTVSCWVLDKAGIHAGHTRSCPLVSLLIILFKHRLEMCFLWRNVRLPSDFPPLRRLAMIILKSHLERLSVTRFAGAYCLITSVQIGRGSFTAIKMINWAFQ